MRIAYLHYLDAADTAQHHVRQFAAAARALGHTVDVHAIRAPPAGADGMASGEMSGAVGGAESGAPPAPGGPSRLRRALARYLHEPRALAANAWYLRREISCLRAGQRPDVLLVRDEPLAAASLLAAAHLRLPLVYEMNAPAVELALYRDEYLHLPAVAGWIEGLKLRRADAVVTVSGALRSHLLDRHRAAAGTALAEAKVVAVPNGADLTAFQPSTAPSALARRLLAAAAEAGAAGPVIGFAGSFQKFHGIDLLIETALAVGAARPAARFLLAGDGPGAARVRQGVAPLGGRAVLTGRVPHREVPGLVAAFDIGVLPDTAFYACPLKVLEWMAAGKAVVAPAYGPLRELIDDRRHGLLFPPRDGAALAAAVRLLVDRPELRQELGAAAAVRARTLFSWSDTARRVTAALAQARAAALRAGRGLPDLVAQS